MKRIAILHTINGQQYADLIAKELFKLNVDVTVAPWTQFIPINSVDKLPQWDLVHIRFGGLGSTLQLLKTLDILGYDLINSAVCIEHTTNKFLGTLVAEKKAGVKTPRTFLFDKRCSCSLIDKMEYPVVVKPLMSHQGRNVSKINSQNQFEDYLLTYSENMVLVQEFIAYSKLFRAIMVGDNVIDLAFDIPKDGWKATVCLNPMVKKHEVTYEIEEFCFKLKKAFRGEILAIDFFETPTGYVFNEINNACNFYPMQEVTKVNHAQKIAQYLHNRLGS